MTALKPKILVVDDDEQILTQMDWALKDDFQVLRAVARGPALAAFRAESPSLVILDLGLPPHPRDAREGLASLEEILRENPAAKVLIISGNSDRANAFQAVRLGAFDFFSKPVNLEELKVVLGRALFLIDLEREGRAPASGGEPFEELLGTSRQMLEIFQTISKAAPTDVPVLITGESGTGKELIARAIYQRSLRKGGPFVPINCGAIPAPLLESELFGHEKGAFTGAIAQRKGRFQEAQDGTLFLDEIGELELGLQVKLLRFLQDGIIERVGGRDRIPLDTRVIAATNKDLVQAAARGEFREDLYYRLAVIRIAVPPLRERPDDILLLANSFLRRYALEYKKTGLRSFSPQAEEAVQAYPWPGNVRELENRIKRAIVMSEGPAITVRELELQEASCASGPKSEGRTMKQAKEKLEREMVQRAMNEAEGNISRAARILGISRPTLYELIQKFEIKGFKQ